MQPRSKKSKIRPVDLVVAGIGTDVGKTVVSAILATLFQADYWKPIQSGQEQLDTEEMRKLLSTDHHTIHQPSYSLKAPLSPHHAARLERIAIDPQRLIPPKTNRPLIAEMAGGIFVPLTLDLLTIDLFSQWQARWVLVSNNYLGSINHTLLTVEALKLRNIDLAGVIFNGNSNPDSEKAILHQTSLPCLGRVHHEPKIDRSTIQKWAKLWQQSGTLSLR